VAWEVGVSPDAEHDRGGERLADAGGAAGGVQLLGFFGVGVFVEELVEQRDRVGVGLSLLPGGERDRDRQAGCLPAAEADVEVDLDGLGDRDVLDLQAGGLFALAC
jgi:hypothetical protein